MQRKPRTNKEYRSSNYQKQQFYPKKKRVCYFCAEKVDPDYKNVSLLKRYITEKGKILSAKITKTCAKHQRRLAKAIKRARMIALLPFIDKYKD